MKKSKGFTLIELMVVVVILGILAVVVAPRIPDLVNKAREGATKGALATMRSTLNIYYSDTEGIYPLGNLETVLVPKYIKSIPTVKLPKTPHTETNAVQYYNAYPGGDTGRWGYCNDPTSNDYGNIWVDCTHTDSKGTVWNTY